MWAGCRREPIAVASTVQRSPARGIASGRSGNDISPAIAKGDNSRGGSGTDYHFWTFGTLSVHPFREGYEHGCQAIGHFPRSLSSHLDGKSKNDDWNTVTVLLSYS